MPLDSQRSQLFSGVQVVLLDIEGTIAPISFVYDVMFPFARAQILPYLREHFEEPAVQADLNLFRSLVAQSPAGLGGPALAAQDAPRDQQIEALVAHVHWQMDTDQKTTALKSLQGKVWKGGFESGALRSVVFPDVPRAMRDWRDSGKRVAIYSSGSVQAQQLFLKYCEAGDLSELVSGWFDTTSGPKREASSYEAIAAQLQVDPAAVLFATDVVGEADAATRAGMAAVILARPGNSAQPAHFHPVLEAFGDPR